MIQNRVILISDSNLSLVDGDVVIIKEPTKALKDSYTMCFGFMTLTLNLEILSLNLSKTIFNWMCCVINSCQWQL